MFVENVANEAIQPGPIDAPGGASAGPELLAMGPVDPQCPAAVALPIAHHSAGADLLGLDQAMHMLRPDMQGNQVPAAVAADFLNRCPHGATIFLALEPEGPFRHEVPGEGFERGADFDAGPATVRTASLVTREVRTVGSEGEKVRHIGVSNVTHGA